MRKIADGSSIIDILVYLETCKGRKVYLDYRTNPAGGEFSYDALLPEAREYLTRAGACFGTPIERLAHMNQPAIDFYRDKGVDLYTQPLEIALCAQHNNGGIGIDCWWQTVRGRRGRCQPRRLPPGRYGAERRAGGQHPRGTVHCRPLPGRCVCQF